MVDKTELKDVALIINDPTATGGIKSLNMNNQVLPNVGDPINPGDAVNKKYMDAKFGELSGALVFKGTLNADGAATQLADAKPGWLWVVNEAGTLVGEVLKIGDEVFCKVVTKGAPKDFTNFEKVPSSDGVLRTTDVINNLTSTATDKPVSALQAKTLNDTKADKTLLSNVTRNYHSSARNTGSQYLYLGDITNFFSQDSNICVIDVYGQGDYDPGITQQTHYTLIEVTH